VICPDSRLPHGKAKTLEAVDAKLRIAEVVKKADSNRESADDTDASTAIRRPRGTTNYLCGRSEDADSIAAVVPAVTLLHKGDSHDSVNGTDRGINFANENHERLSDRQEIQDRCVLERFV
jgi:hypothetical protein